VNVLTYLLFKLTIITYQFMKFKPFLYVSLVHFVILESLFPSQDTFLLVISNSLGDHYYPPKGFQFGFRVKLFDFCTPSWCLFILLILFLVR